MRRCKRCIALKRRLVGGLRLAHPTLAPMGVGRVEQRGGFTGCGKIDWQHFQDNIFVSR
jgi:hypothetical protein